MPTDRPTDRPTERHANRYADRPTDDYTPAHEHEHGVLSAVLTLSSLSRGPSRAKKTCTLLCGRTHPPSPHPCNVGVDYPCRRTRFRERKNVHFPFSAAAQEPGNTAWGAGCRRQHRRAWKSKSARFFRSGREGIEPHLAPNRAPSESRASVDEGRRPWAWMGRRSSMQPASTRAAQREQHTTQRKTTPDNTLRRGVCTVCFVDA